MTVHKNNMLELWGSECIPKRICFTEYLDCHFTICISELIQAIFYYDSLDYIIINYDSLEE